MTKTTIVGDEVTLIDKEVKVVPVKREGGWLPAGHDGEFMFTGCKRGYCLPIDRNKGTFVQLFKSEEMQAFFEKRLTLKEGDLSIYKKDDNFWKKFYVKVDKEGMTLNLMDPMDNLRWRVLQLNPEIAPSWQDRFNSPGYKFAIVEEDVEVSARVKSSDLKKKAYRFLGQVEGDADKMLNFLRAMGRKPAKNVKREYLVSEIDKIIEDARLLKRMCDIIDDPLYSQRLFIDDAVDAGSVQKIGQGKYSIVGIDTEFSQAELISFLSENKHQDIKLKITSQIEGYRKSSNK